MNLNSSRKVLLCRHFGAPQENGPYLAASSETSNKRWINDEQVEAANHRTAAVPDEHRAGAERVPALAALRWPRHP
jgi:hypothetical protein